MSEEKLPIKCKEAGCECSIAWIEAVPNGEKVITIGGKHHGEKHYVQLSKRELLDIFKTD